MKFVQLIENNKKITFIQKSCRKWGEKLVSDLFLFVKKGLNEVKAFGLLLSFNIFR